MLKFLSGSYAVIVSGIFAGFGRIDTIWKQQGLVRILESVGENFLNRHKHTILRLKANTEKKILALSEILKQGQ